MSMVKMSNLGSKGLGFDPRAVPKKWMHVCKYLPLLCCGLCYIMSLIVVSVCTIVHLRHWRSLAPLFGSVYITVLNCICYVMFIWWFVYIICTVLRGRYCVIQHSCCNTNKTIIIIMLNLFYIQSVKCWHYISYIYSWTLFEASQYCNVWLQFMTLTYLLNATWMGITSFVALSIVIHVMLNSVCNVEVFEQRFQYIDTEWGFCLNLSRFGQPSFCHFLPFYKLFCNYNQTCPITE